MKHYSQEYLDILYRLSESGVEIIDDLTRKQRNPYMYLHREGLIFYGYRKVDGERILCVEINPEGRTYLSTLEKEELRFSKTHKIAVLALIISIISLLWNIAPTVMTALSQQ